jgi:hypothetical protein
MTEADWLACDDPEVLLTWLRQQAADEARRRRRLLLFACACCRLVWRLLDDGPGQRALEGLERHLDGASSLEEVFALTAEVRQEQDRSRMLALLGGWHGRREALAAVEAALDAIPLTTLAQPPGATTNVPTSWPSRRIAAEVAQVARHVARATEPSPQGLTKKEAKVASKRAKLAARKAQAGLLRDVFGNPFRPVVVAPSWSSWNNGTAVAIARAVRDEGRWAELPILADALEEAGCTSAPLLTHLRNKGPHARGCWALEALLSDDG